MVLATLLCVWLDACARTPLDTSGSEDSMVSTDGPTSGGVICGGTYCLSNEVCCVIDGKCIDPTNAALSCQKPDAGIGSVQRTCGSNTDCQPDEFCSPSQGCLGPGLCVARSNCGSSTGTSTFCGCDGKNYSSVQAACLVGIKTSAHPGACGVGTPVGLGRDPVTFCGFDSQCPDGQKCCPISGKCYDRNISVLCSTPPLGTLASCVEDRQCDVNEFCEGPGCSGPGGCLFEGGLCSGELMPVCGCDGRTYVDRSCTVPAGVRISHIGACGMDGGVSN
jgi:hypothetical protein